MHFHLCPVDHQIFRRIFLTSDLDGLCRPVFHIIVYVLKDNRGRFGSGTRTVKDDVHLIVVVPFELLVCRHRDLVPAVVVVYGNGISFRVGACMHEREVHDDA